MANPTPSLEQLPEEVMRLVDAMDVEALAAMLTDDAQGIDEISRGWIRGRPALEAYFQQLRESVSNVRSSVRDVHTLEWGDTAAVTFVLEQSYAYEGDDVEITAPTSLVCRRDAGAWKIAVFHSAPLPEASD